MRSSVLRLMLALGALVGFGWLARIAPGAGAGQGELLDQLGSNFTGSDRDLMGAGASMGLLLLGGWLAGLIAAQFGIARVTGYLLFGVLVGPDVLGLVPQGEVPYLTLINDLAVSLIALTAGGEIRLEFLRESWKRVVTIASSIMLVIGAGVFVLMLIVAPAIGISAGRFDTSTIVVAALCATIATSNSPAIVIALIAELRARGPMSKLALSATVCKDMFLVIVFSIVLAIGASAIGSSGEGAGESSGLLDIAVPLLVHLVGSVVVGAVAGLLMASYMHWVRAHVPIFIVLACFGIALLSEALHLEALLVAVTAGMLMENVWEESSESLFEGLEELSLPVYCMFFAVAGIRVNLDAIGAMWHFALLAVVVRGVSLWGGCAIGCRLSGVEAGPARTWLWTAFVPQAGVSIALATIVNETFKDQDFGPILFNLIMAMIAVHELAGPILMKIGLAKAGEVDGDR